MFPLTNVVPPAPTPSAERIHSRGTGCRASAQDTQDSPQIYIKLFAMGSWNIVGEPGLVDRVLALHAGSRGFDSHRGHMSEQFFRSNRPGYPHPVSSELENSGVRVVITVSLNVGGGVRLIKPAKLYMCTQNTTNTTRTDARRRLCAAMVPYRWSTRGTSLRELEYTHTHTHTPEILNVELILTQVIIV